MAVGEGSLGGTQHVGECEPLLVPIPRSKGRSRNETCVDALGTPEDGSGRTRRRGAVSCARRVRAWNCHAPEAPVLLSMGGYRAARRVGNLRAAHAWCLKSLTPRMATTRAPNQPAVRRLRSLPPFYVRNVRDCASGSACGVARTCDSSCGTVGSSASSCRNVRGAQPPNHECFAGDDDGAARGRRR